ncbi:RBBP9/YdeN family alpha/beta hydrolase, partial [Methylomagnum sp.]
VPGLRGSGPDHWQSWWEAREPRAARVGQTDWHAPDLARWSAQVGAAIDRAETPVWLVAHSFGCLASVHAAARRPERVAGALLVAPANPDKFGIGPDLPAQRLPYPSLLVASLNDPWMAFERAADWSARWGCRLVNLGRAGHINVESGFGPWPRGPRLLEELQHTAANHPETGASLADGAFGAVGLTRPPAALALASA